MMLDACTKKQDERRQVEKEHLTSIDDIMLLTSNIFDLLMFIVLGHGNISAVGRTLQS